MNDMTDVKAAKLAAARKKLKDHQEKKNVKPVSSTEVTTDSVHIVQFVEDQETVLPQFQNEERNEIKQPDLSNDSKSETVSSHAHAYYPFDNANGRRPEIPLTMPSAPETDWQWQLQQQRQNHMKATEILISDKRNLESKVRSFESSFSTLKGKYAETIEDLNIAKQSTLKLETELRDSKEYIKMLRHELESKNSELDSYKRKQEELLERKSELEEKMDATKTALSTRDMENSSLLNQLSQVQRELDITQLHLQQLTNGGTVTDNETNVNPKMLLDQNKSLQHQNSRLEQQIKMIVSEKEQLAMHYQHYIQQLNEELEAEMTRNRQKQQEYDDLANRESSLVDQMSQMEKRMQTLQDCIAIHDKNEHSLTSSQSAAHELVELKLQFEANKAQLHLLEEDYKTVKKNLSASEEKVIELTETIQTLQNDQPDVTKLSAANESDRVAAQRATVQNAKLKEELNGLQDAFVVMSNDKLELIEKLQAEKFLNRELTIKLSECEETLKHIQNKLLAKDEEMIRLQAHCSNLEREVLQNSQEIDRLRHYEVTKSTDEVLQAELDLAQQTITQLRHEIAMYKKNKNVADANIDSTTEYSVNDTKSTPCEGGENERLICKESILTDTNLNIIPTEEAMMKLQQRFLKTMKEVAELSDEKQNLEHIVLQLQGETETICEYIALYQQQRGILKQREEERTAQMKYLAAERERMQSQLEELQRMITSGSSNAGQQPDTHLQQENITKIVNLLSEIKQSHLIDPKKQCTGMENFHPCPWCSGKLINV